MSGIYGNQFVGGGGWGVVVINSGGVYLCMYGY